MPEFGAHAVYALASEFRDGTLRSGRSLLWPDRDAWTVENIDDLLETLVVNPDDAKGTFIERLRLQLEPKRADVHCVAADALAVYLLFPDSSSADTKLGQLAEVASWKIGPFDRTDVVADAFGGIGGSGLHYVTARAWQIAYILLLGRAALQSHIDMGSPMAVRELADATRLEVTALRQQTGKGANYQVHEGDAARNILLHLLFPDHFEPIASEAHRRDIVQRFVAYAEGVTDVDEALERIRAGLSPRYGIGFDFYRSDVRREWDPDEATPTRYWVEKTQVTGRAGRETGRYAFGRVLWSPQEDSQGGDAFRSMREVTPGDVVLHLRDRRAITAFSRVAAPVTRDFVCPSDTEWAGQPGLLVNLAGFTYFDPVLPIDLLLSPRFEERLLDVLEGGTTSLFYNRDLSLDQDDYLTQVPPELLELLNESYRVVSGRTLMELIESDPLKELLDATHLPRADLTDLLELLDDKKQVILEGPPGAGKTYVAEHVARFLTGNPLRGPHDDRVRIVQFHQSYGYEDFIQGIRPETRKGQVEYHVRDGVFKEFVQRAAVDTDHTYVMLIDEINRGNMSRIFGELLYLLEYREKSLTLPNAEGKGGEAATSHTEFTIPDNIRIIGTMNTADRSLAQLDYALRRRFYFYRLSPMIHHSAPVLEAWLASKQVPADVQSLVLRLFLRLNAKLTAELGDDYLVGHSYLMNDKVTTDAGRRQIWKHAVLPLLAEYFYNRQNKDILSAYTIDALLANTAEP